MRGRCRDQKRHGHEQNKPIAIHDHTDCQRSRAGVRVILLLRRDRRNMLRLVVRHADESPESQARRERS